MGSSEQTEGEVIGVIEQPVVLAPVKRVAPPWMKAVVRGVVIGGVFAGLTFFTYGADMKGYEVAGWQAGKAFFSYLALRIGEGAFDQYKSGRSN